MKVFGEFLCINQPAVFVFFQRKWEREDEGRVWESRGDHSTGGKGEYYSLLYACMHVRTPRTFSWVNRGERGYLNGDLVTIYCDWQKKEGVDGRMLSAPDNSCLLHLQEGRQKVRDRERESRRDPYTHKQMHSNALLHIFPLKLLVASFISYVMHMGKSRLQSPTCKFPWAQTIHWHSRCQLRCKVTNPQLIHTHRHTLLLNIHWSGVMNGSQQWIMDHILMVDLPLSLLAC